MPSLPPPRPRQAPSADDPKQTSFSDDARLDPISSATHDCADHLRDLRRAPSRASPQRIRKAVQLHALRQEARPNEPVPTRPPARCGHPFRTRRHGTAIRGMCVIDDGGLDETAKIRYLSWDSKPNGEPITTGSRPRLPPCTTATPSDDSGSRHASPCVPPPGLDLYWFPVALSDDGFPGSKSLDTVEN